MIWDNVDDTDLKISAYKYFWISVNPNQIKLINDYDEEEL